VDASLMTRLKLRSVGRRLKQFANLGRLPNALIIGAQKAGTTTLFDWLALHPDIEAFLRKELRFFDANFARGAAWYRSNFSISGWRPIALEASPCYLFQPWVPTRVRDLIPDAKFIAILRNPVDRAFSHYQHNVRRGREPLSFHDALAKETERIESPQAELASGEGGRMYNRHHYSYVARGLYAPQIERWLSHFARNQFLFVDFNDLKNEPQQTLSTVCEFLGIKNFTLPDQEPRNQGEYAPLEPDVRERLEDVFRLSNERVEELTGIPLYGRRPERPLSPSEPTD